MFTRLPGSRGLLRRQSARGANEPQRSSAEARLWQPGASLPGQPASSQRHPLKPRPLRPHRVARETRSRVPGALLTRSPDLPLPVHPKSLGRWTLAPSPVISLSNQRSKGERRENNHYILSWGVLNLYSKLKRAGGHLLTSGQDPRIWTRINYDSSPEETEKLITFTVCVPGTV